jgi:hypothetical protein
MAPRVAYPSEPGPVLVSKMLRESPPSGRILSLVVGEKTPRFRDGDLLHVFLDGSPIESIAPREGLFSVVISHLSGKSHRVSLRFSRKDQTEWGAQLLLTVPPIPPSFQGGRS